MSRELWAKLLTTHSSWLIANFQLPNSSEGTSVPRQAVKRVARNPCKKSSQKKSKRRKRDRIVFYFFCRTFGTMIDIRSLPFSLLSLALITSHHISARIGKSQRVVEAVGVAVVGLGVF